MFPSEMLVEKSAVRAHSDRIVGYGWAVDDIDVLVLVAQRDLWRDAQIPSSST